MERCLICNQYMWFPASHKCQARWVAVMFGSDEPDRPFTWSDYEAYTELFADTAKDAAEEAAERFNSDTCEYSSSQTVGVMAYDDYCEWYYSDENTEDFADPAKLTWFDVACNMEPTYSANIKSKP